MTNASRVLVHAYSFEERCAPALEYGLSNFRPDLVLSIRYDQTAEELVPALIANVNRCDFMVADAGVRHEVIRSDISSQIQIVRSVAACAGDAKEIVLDISCLTKLHILRLLHQLYGRISHVVYVGGSRHTAHAQGESGTGHRQCVAVLGFEGLCSPQSPLLAVILAGYEGDRGLSTMLELDPAIAVAAIGVPWTQPEVAMTYVTTALEVNRPLLAHHNVFAELVPSLSPRDFSSRLRDIIAQHRERVLRLWRVQPRIVVVPICTKIQCLGLYFYWSKHPAVRILYPVPSAYRRVSYGYSAPIVTSLREFGKGLVLREVVEKAFAAERQPVPPSEGRCQ